MHLIRGFWDGEGSILVKVYKWEKEEKAEKRRASAGFSVHGRSLAQADHLEEALRMLNGGRAG